MKVKPGLFARQQEYLNKYSKIVVTYHDGVKKVFDPIDWATFEDRVTPIAKNIEWFEIGEEGLITGVKKSTYVIAIVVIVVAVLSLYGLIAAFGWVGK